MNRNLNTGIARIKFKNSHTVYESFIKCTVKDYEYNLSYNPTLLSGSQGILLPYSASNGGSIVYINSGSNYGILKDFTTGSISGSDFSPYVGAIGLYNDGGDLLAVGKMAAPIPLSVNTDTTFVIKYDTQWLKKPYFTPSVTPSGTPYPTPTNTPSITLSPIPPPVATDCTIGKTTAIFMVSNTPSVTPNISVTPTISVTPSVTPSNPNISVTPTPTPTPTKLISNATLTFTGYTADDFTFTLSTRLNTAVVITGAKVRGGIYTPSPTTQCRLSSADQYDYITNQYTATIPAGSTSVTCNGYAGSTGQPWSTQNSQTILSYQRDNSLIVNGVTLSNGGVINIGGTQVTIVINTNCTGYTY